MAQIHPTAIIDPAAELASDVVIGAYSIIKGHVIVDAGTEIYEHCHVHGPSIIGKNCKIGPAAYVGLAPQHLKFDGKGCYMVLGDNVIIRETATVHRSTHPGREHATRVGNNCMLMAGAHVGHDCVLGTHVVVANAALIGGHVTVGDRTFLGGGSAFHQFIRIGRLVIVSGNEAISHDIPPFAAVRYRGLKGYNAIGCRRAGMSRATIYAVRRAFHILHTTRNVKTALEAIRSIASNPEIEELLEFYEISKRGVVPSVKQRLNNTNGMISESVLACNNSD